MFTSVVHGANAPPTTHHTFRHRPYWSETGLDHFLSATNALVTGRIRLGVPVVRVFHTDGPDTADNPFARASGLIRALDGLVPFDAALTVEKHRHSALAGRFATVCSVGAALERAAKPGAG